MYFFSWKKKIHLFLTPLFLSLKADLHIRCEFQSIGLDFLPARKLEPN